MSRPLHDFNRDELSAYLAEHVPGFEQLDDITRFSDGQSNPTYKVMSGTRAFVVRAKPPGKLLPSAHQVDREFRVMQALADSDVPVPEMLHLSGEETPLGPQFFVMEMMDGRVFWDPALPELTKVDRAAVFAEMNKTLAALHSIDPNAVGLGDYGKPGNYFARQVSRWTRQYRAAEMETVPQVDWLIGWLEDNLPEDDNQIAIVHGDYRLDNTMFAPDRPEMIAVLDWELSTLGHPMADLAYQCMGLHLPNQGLVRGLGGMDREALGIPSEEDFVAAYCDRRGIALPAEWPFYLSFSYFRLISIIQGVIRRAADGNASNPGNIGALRLAVPWLAEAARAIARNPRSA